MALGGRLTRSVVRRFAAAFGGEGSTVPLDWGGGALRVHVPSMRVAHSRLHPREKEPWTVAWLERHAGPGEVIWDVGANVGTYALIAASLGARVVAVEPDALNGGALTRNAMLNRLDPSITLLPVALGSAPGLGCLAPGERLAGSTHRVAERDVADGASSVLLFRLDDLLETVPLPRPTALKIDVDGAEVGVLEGATRTLSDPCLRALIVEIEEENGSAVVALAAAAGLELVERHDSRDGVSLGELWYGVFERTSG